MQVRIYEAIKCECGESANFNVHYQPCLSGLLPEQEKLATDKGQNIVGIMKALPITSCISLVSFARRTARSGYVMSVVC
jgi:hypothetical protein